ncbi:glycosyltransferase family protein [Mycolicibacterium arenosum]|uniref:Glycosyltransferase family 1 protein n=1 Tax=Mycolicibacterium arenosum TaxID=2952157 RepID=A0ABT1M3P6_9MYCO|nr:glycosyltransferase family 1 protein [Mycolicibacterium sp. CAU 1645]MCP9273788.1 glycosyltransferase family 1 protein [Mycolicibacterium sp. CAU 1645]
MGATLQDYRLVFVGPMLGHSAVGDYAEDIVTAVRPYFGDVAQVRTGGPGEDTLADARRHRRAVAQLIADAPAGRVLVHAELSTAAISPFWATAGLRGVPVTGTVHDPPQGVWMPARTRFVAKSRLLNHGIHYPARPLSRKLEGAVYRDRTLFALTETGRQSIARVYPSTHTRYIPHVVRDRPDITPAHERPRAVGFFGHVYRGKGFEQIERLRALLPADIGIRVAGRGTEDLPAIAGVEILGPVDGAAEDAFFASVRAIVVPYGKRHFYADSFAASGVVAHATAYCTPQICTDYAALVELDEAAGAVVARVNQAGAPADSDTVTNALASAITGLLDDDARMAELSANSARTRQQRSAARTGEAFAAAWTETLGLDG